MVTVLTLYLPHNSFTLPCYSKPMNQYQLAGVFHDCDDTGPTVVVTGNADVISLEQAATDETEILSAHASCSVCGDIVETFEEGQE